MNGSHELRVKPWSWSLAHGGAVIFALIAGCAGGPASGPVNLSGFSAAFKQGYADGCESAGSRSRQRNESRYKTESEYMQGWNDGFSVCRR